MAEENITEEMKSFCITQCSYGKKKAGEYLQICDSVFDAAADMQDMIEVCSKSNNCEYTKSASK